MTDTTELEPVTNRRRLLNLGYRMLGSLAEAEDVVQETYARWYALSPRRRAEVRVPGAWLTTVASRICLDQLGSARARRESYVGQWVPEPVPDQAEWNSGRSGGAPTDPAEQVVLDESVNLAFLVVLDAMTPAERVVFVLHDVFGYPFAEVAAMVGRTPAACRKLATVARRRIHQDRPAAATPHPGDLVSRFRQACERGDVTGLIGLLDPDTVMSADGGGVVRAAPRPIHGAEPVARYLTGLLRKGAEVEILERSVNGQPGLVARRNGATVAVLAFDPVGDRVRRIWAVRNPDKLRQWAALD